MRIAIIFGGSSYEHEISIVSAISLKKVLHDDLIFIFLDQHREFYLIPAEKMVSTLFSSGKYKKERKLYLDNRGFVYKKNVMLERVINFAFVINLVHGRDGEDGKLSAMLQFYQIRAITPPIEAAVISYNKELTKEFAKRLNIKVLDYEVLNFRCRRIIPFDFHVIIKPLRLGSSIGVTIVDSQEELDYALDVAFEFDSVVLVEPFLEGVKEYNLAGYCADGVMHHSIVEEPHKEEFLDFEKKYMDFSRSEQVLKADISAELEKRLQANFDKVYTGLFEGALIRCDFFVHNDEVLLNEINPIPGSMANYLFEDFPSAIESLANSLPHAKRPKVTYEYIHSISQAKGK